MSSYAISTCSRLISRERSGQQASTSRSTASTRCCKRARCVHRLGHRAKLTPQVFFISRARVSIAKKQFNNVNNEYEIMFGNDTEIDPVRVASS